jgi:hypothetical protein
VADLRIRIRRDRRRRVGARVKKTKKNTLKENNFKIFWRGMCSCAPSFVSVTAENDV